MTNPLILGELQRIATRNCGLLRPEDVVDAARDRKSPLHEQFDWDDSEAAGKWRIHQARQLIRVTVTYREEVKQNVRVFVSLTPDRENDGGGYRSMVAVLSDSESRKQLLADAMAELNTFEAKYRALDELAGVFAAIRSTRKKVATE
jgi:hypothetical protein